MALKSTEPLPNFRDARSLVMKLMAIPGTSGQETAVAEFIQAELRRVGVPPSAWTIDSAHRRTPIQGEMGNMALKLATASHATRRLGPRRMLMAHMDTVPICVGSRPVRRGNIVRSSDPRTGLGADDRAGVAVVLFVARELIRLEVDHPPLTFLWTVQEEIGLQGARHVRRGMLGKPSLAFNWDGGSPHKLTIGATGGYRMEINIRGIASHAGNKPEEGVSAIAISSAAITELHDTGWHGQIRKEGQYGTSNVGIIRGGQATNVVTDHVYVKAEARSHNGTFRKRIVREIQAAFRRAVKRVKNQRGRSGRVEFEGTLDYDSFCMDRHEPCVQAAESAIRSDGGEPELAIALGGVDANWMFAHGIPTVTLGCGQSNPHMVSESLDLRRFETACRIAWRLATATEGAGL